MQLYQTEQKKNKFKFIDLFAGIGGFRIALENLGGECVFSSEWNKYCQITYQANFGEIPNGDLTKIALGQQPTTERSTVSVGA